MGKKNLTQVQENHFMAENPISVSVVINAPVECVWSVLIEHELSNKQQMIEQKYIQIKPAGDLEGGSIPGQVIHTKFGFLDATMCIDKAVQANPPIIGQTISFKISFLGREGDGVVHWERDLEHYSLQSHSKVNHPWFKLIDQTTIRCITMDTTSCVIVYVGRSEMTPRLLPHWLIQRFNKDSRKAETTAIEKSLQSIKAKAELNHNQAVYEGFDI